jgi:hypothetical protein
MTLKEPSAIGQKCFLELKILSISEEFYSTFFFLFKAVRFSFKIFAIRQEYFPLKPRNIG